MSESFLDQVVRLSKLASVIDDKKYLKVLSLILQLKNRSMEGMSYIPSILSLAESEMSLREARLGILRASKEKLIGFEYDKNPNKLTPDEKKKSLLGAHGVLAWVKVINKDAFEAEMMRLMPEIEVAPPTDRSPVSDFAYSKGLEHGKYDISENQYGDPRASYVAYIAFAKKNKQYEGSWMENYESYKRGYLDALENRVSAFWRRMTLVKLSN